MLHSRVSLYPPSRSPRFFFFFFTLFPFLSSLSLELVKIGTKAWLARTPLFVLSPCNPYLRYLPSRLTAEQSTLTYIQNMYSTHVIIIDALHPVVLAVGCYSITTLHTT